MSENTLNITLNGEKVTGYQGETIYKLATRLGIEIPTLCNDKRLEPFSSCYVCVVEIENVRGLQPSCSTKISEGMKITTNSEKVLNARKMALDLLLSNHYADCAAPCKETCPAGVDVQGYISLINKKMYSEAVELIKETNPLPAICGRVCVRPCEVACRRNLVGDDNVSIDYLKRFASDIDLASITKFRPHLKENTGKKVAVIGAGPAGLSAAFFLRKEGHNVDIYEAAPKAGGWLRYGIPEYRLPNDLIQKEVDNITELGVNIFYNKKLGENLKYLEIKEKYNAVILGIGSQGGTNVGCEGDDAPNVLSGVDFLKKMELTGEKEDFTGKIVAVIGGGNTAMDCCRTSIRCGSTKVYIIYRRTEKEMPANPIEIHESKLEGVEYMFLTAPVRINKNADGTAKSITCIKMELGEPDASGRRRPVPVPNSDIDVEIDFVIAAIGQKTILDFTEDVNSCSTEVLKANKWGDIEANPKTLQTGVKSIFAAGDGVTGPATLIQAIAQAKIAALSCHQYLSGLPIVPPKKEFLSKRNNFKVQVSADYHDKYLSLTRNHMPVLAPEDRFNFDEVELGLENEDIAVNETQRCLECGCNEYFDCDLKKYSTQYNVEQKKFDGEFIEYNVDFRHPFIEIDNNKCILCSRCVRICGEVVGASALGLVNRGFKTYVAPTMGNSLQETHCESCGMCISTCPTGAITENFKFKPGPVKTESFNTVCNYCSIGCEISIHHKNGFVMKVTGNEGQINKTGNICRFPKFGYNYLNDNKLITKPLLKTDGKFHEISFEKAFDLISDKIKSVNENESAFFAGARLTNEEMYLIQKLGRKYAKSNKIASFHYLNRGSYSKNSVANVPFHDLFRASKIYLLGSEINLDNAVLGFEINNLKEKSQLQVSLITNKTESSMKYKVNEIFNVKDYFSFVKAVNYYLVKNNLQNSLFINDNTVGFEEYKNHLFAENFSELILKSGLIEKQISDFAEDFNNQMNAVLVFSEKEISSATSSEIFNLAMITGKLGKTSSGIISLKEKNNSQGLFDMGISQDIDFGGIENHENKAENILQSIQNHKIKNLFIFGEDPIGCAVDKNEISNILSKAEFFVVQDYFMTETAQNANLILPSEFSFLNGGSYTNTQKVIQKFDKIEGFKSIVEKSNIEQLLEISRKFENQQINDREDVMNEIISNLSNLPKSENQKFAFEINKSDNWNRIFNYGCDNLVKKFEDEFNQAFEK